MICPGATWRPVQNHGGPIPVVVSGRGLVVHVQEGNGSPWGWFNNPASQVSSHWWISKAGVLEQYVDTDFEAWAQMAGNASYHSVETEGLASEALTTAQAVMLAALYRWGHQMFGWPFQTCDHGGRGLTTHAHYPSGIPDPAWGGHPCPGALRAGQLPSILKLAGQPSEDEMYLIRNNGTGQVATTDGTHKVYLHDPASENAYLAAGFKLVDVDPVDYDSIPNAT